MEALPRLPMLSFDLKNSSEYVEFGPTLKQYIKNHYGEDPALYNKACTDLEQLRQAAIQVSRDVMGCTTLKKYFAQLQYLQGRFPMGEGGEAAIAFTWEDVQTARDHCIYDVKFEQASILYNIGSLHSLLGALDTRHNAEGMKVSCTHFQCAAWAFEFLRNNFSTSMSTDMSYELLNFHIILMLAQAQECILEKSIFDNRKNNITAKVAAKVVEFYKEASTLIDAANSKQQINSRMHKDYSRRLIMKSAFYQSITYFYLGREAEDAEKPGECLAYFTAAKEELTKATQLAKNEVPEVLESIRFAKDVIVGKYESAKKDNDLVYHAKVPSIDTLPEIKGACLVKGIPFDTTDKEISGPDIFQKLVPIEAHEASSVYSEEKAKLSRTVIGEVDQKNMELDHFLSSLQLDMEQLMPKPNIIPDDLMEKCAAMSVRTNAIKELTDAMGGVSGLTTEVEIALGEIQQLIDEDKEKTEQMEKQYGKRNPSSVLPRLQEELTVHRQRHEEGNQLNATLHKAMHAHISNLKILVMSPSEISNLLPPCQPALSADDEKIVAEMRRLLQKVTEMKEQRKGLVDQFRDKLHKDDITNVLVTQEVSDKEAVFREQLKKHDQTVTFIKQNLAAQDNILRHLTDTNAKYALIRQAFAEASNKRDKTVQDLILSYEKYEELLAKSQKGAEYYKKLLENVTKTLERCRSECKVRHEERDMYLTKFAPKAPAPSRPSAPKPGVNSADVTATPGASLEPDQNLSTLDNDAFSMDLAYHSMPPSFEGPKLKDYLPFMKPRSFGPKSAMGAPQDTEPSLPLPPDSPSLGYGNNTGLDPSLASILPVTLAQYLASKTSGVASIAGGSRYTPSPPQGSPQHLASRAPVVQPAPPVPASTHGASQPLALPSHQSYAPVSQLGSDNQFSSSAPPQTDFYSQPSVTSQPQWNPGVSRNNPQIITSSAGHPQIPVQHPPSHFTGASQPSTQPSFPITSQNWPVGQYQHINPDAAVFSGQFSQPHAGVQSRHDQPLPSAVGQNKFNSSQLPSGHMMPSQAQVASNFGHVNPSGSIQYMPSHGTAQQFLNQGSSQVNQGHVPAQPVQGYGQTQMVQGQTLQMPVQGQNTGQSNFVPNSGQGIIPSQPYTTYNPGQLSVSITQGQNQIYHPIQQLPSQSSTAQMPNQMYIKQSQFPDQNFAGHKQILPGSDQASQISSQGSITHGSGLTSLGIASMQGPVSQSQISSQPSSAVSQTPSFSNSRFSGPQNFQQGLQTSQNFQQGLQTSQNFQQGPQTGQNFQKGSQTNQSYQQGPQTGQSYQQGPQTGQNFQKGPQTGQSYQQGPQTGQSFPQGPQTGQSFQQGPQTGQSYQQGPQTGQSYQQGPQTGQSLQQGSQSSQSYQQGPQTGQSYQQGPQTGQSYQQGPQTGQSYQQGPQTGQSFQQGPQAGQHFQKLPQAGQNFQQLPQAGQNNPSFVQNPGQQFDSSHHSQAKNKEHTGQASANSGLNAGIGQVNFTMSPMNQNIQNSMPPTQSQAGYQPGAPTSGVQAFSQGGGPQSQLSQYQSNTPQVPAQASFPTNPVAQPNIQPIIPSGQQPTQNQQLGFHQQKAVSFPQNQQQPMAFTSTQPGVRPAQPAQLYPGSPQPGFQQTGPLAAHQQLYSPAGPQMPLNSYTNQSQAIPAQPQQNLHPAMPLPLQPSGTIRPSTPVQVITQPSVVLSHISSTPTSPTAGLSRQTSSLDDILSSSPNAGVKDTIITPQVLTDQERQLQKEEAIKNQAKSLTTEPYSSQSTLLKLLTDVESFGKYVDDLSVTILGVSRLDTLWKSLLDSQDAATKKQSMAIARCYSMKNRDQDIMPYDETRVLLTSTKDDYINASWLNDLAPSCPKFITTQAPMSLTISDYWAMVYEQGSEVLVQITSEYETGKNFPVYYPVDKDKNLEQGVILLSLQSVKFRQFWVERILYLKNTQTKQGRTVVHLQFKNWPVSGFPEEISSIISFISEVHNFYLQQRSLTKPIIVHCGLGVGRTGVFTLVYAAMQEVLHGNGLTDLPGLTRRMMQKRKGILCKKEQLKCCYDAVLCFAEDYLEKRGMLVKNPHHSKRQLVRQSPKHQSSTSHTSNDIVLGTVDLQTIRENVGRLHVHGGTDGGKKEESAPKGEAMSQKFSKHSVDSLTSISSLPDVVQQYNEPGQSGGLGEKSSSISSELSSLGLQSGSFHGNGSGLIQDLPADHIKGNDLTPSNHSLSFSGKILQDGLDQGTLPSSLAQLQDPTTFTMGSPDSKKKNKITKASFNQSQGSLQKGTPDPADPLGSLDPLWTLSKK